MLISPSPRIWSDVVHVCVVVAQTMARILEGGCSVTCRVRSVCRGDDDVWRARCDVTSGSVPPGGSARGAGRLIYCSSLRVFEQSTLYENVTGEIVMLDRMREMSVWLQSCGLLSVSMSGEIILHTQWWCTLQRGSARR